MYICDVREACSGKPIETKIHASKKLRDHLDYTLAWFLKLRILTNVQSIICPKQNDITVVDWYQNH